MPCTARPPPPGAPQAGTPKVAAAAPAGEAVDPRLVDADNGLGLALAGRLRQDQPDANLVVSPLSAALALDMACAGAAGATRAAMAGTLGLDRLAGSPEPVNAALLEALGEDDAKVRVTVANALWTRSDQADARQP